MGLRPNRLKFDPKKKKKNDQARVEKNGMNEFPQRRGEGMHILGITFASVIWLAFCLGRAVDRGA